MLSKVFRVTPYVNGKQVIDYGRLVMIDCQTMQQALRQADRWEWARIDYCVIGAVQGHDMYTDSYDRKRGIWLLGVNKPSDYYVGGSTW